MYKYRDLVTQESIIDALECIKEDTNILIDNIKDEKADYDKLNLLVNNVNEYKKRLDHIANQMIVYIANKYIQSKKDKG